jgi:predicted kinase
MRKLILMRGAPGAGKSTFLKEQGLEAFTLCPDDYRLRMAGLTMDEEGEIGIGQHRDNVVWPTLWEDVEAKMTRGELIVLDATFQRGQDFRDARRLAASYHYALHGVDMTTIPLEVAKARNLARAAHKIVPERVIDRAYENFQNNPSPEGICWHSPEEFAKTPLLQALDLPMRDLSAYKAVVHIGDIHSCFAPLEGYFAQGLRDDFFYIFIGDYLDRGLQSAEVMRWLLDEVVPRENTCLLYGNHEIYLHRYAQGKQILNEDFALRTQPALEGAGIDGEAIKRLLLRLEDAFLYSYGEKRVAVTHGGLPKLPPSWIALPSALYWRGVGEYALPIDEIFSEKMAGGGWLQIHGHRNAAKHPIHAASLSYNLEGEVEYGGHLRILVFHEDGRVEEEAIANAVYQDRRLAPLVDAASPTPSDDRVSPALLEKLEQHELVSVKRFKSVEGVRSFNFTSKAFYTRQWDEINTIARGFFVSDAGRIVARSYDKFFNLDERPETKWDRLAESLRFPVTLWRKENGYLGILGYHHEEDTLFFASKSTPDGEYAACFRRLFTESVNDQAQELCKKILRQQNLSLVFEVIEPHFDPHPIRYDAPKLILLDAIYREESFRKVDWEKLQYLHRLLGLPLKERAMLLRDWRQFSGWYASVQLQGRDYRYRGDHIEGFVVEDAGGFQFKIKLPYYSFWKRMRGLKDRIRQMRQRGKELIDIEDWAASDAEAQAFLIWASEQTDETLAKDIATLREDFYKIMRETGEA